MSKITKVILILFCAGLIASGICDIIGSFDDAPQQTSA